MAVYDDMSDNERIRVYDIGVDVQTIDDPTAAHALPVTYRTGDIVSPYIAFQEPLLVQDQHFLDCIRTGTRPNTPGERGLEIVRVLAATDDLQATGMGVSVAGPGLAAAAGLPPRECAAGSPHHRRSHHDATSPSPSSTSRGSPTSCARSWRSAWKDVLTHGRFVGGPGGRAPSRSSSRSSAGRRTASGSPTARTRSS